MESKVQTGFSLQGKAIVHEAPKKKKTKGLPALFAGACAGATEITITYPFESAKTRAQLERRVPAEKLPAVKPGIKGWYAGYAATVTGTTVKAAVQFSSFHIYRSALAGPNGELSTAASIIAGFGAGVTEAVLAVTPAEAIKTKIIDARKVGNTQMSTTIGAVVGILRQHGPAGFFSALGPTILRQSSNAAVKFTVYSELMGAARRYFGKEVHPLVSTLVGSATGVCCAWSTQPLDVIKTRMQSLQARQLYGNAFRCASIILRQEGIGVFWSGVWFRTARLSLTSAIMFPVYEKVYAYVTQAKH
ncbi:mitochondrial carrier domain-containing protein [Aspergillus leporis]|uniref:Mitochondrial carrier domain-containing protein n=1 Tax=Aspergillus leporis TaxID=41062 RepID=A0A5N5WYY8_9EURO|nr:mitochondrial carrier domain-containing protein [Aspergillus leporis]